jgi:hypothetical protein
MSEIHEIAATDLPAGSSNPRGRRTGNLIRDGKPQRDSNCDGEPQENTGEPGDSGGGFVVVGLAILGIIIWVIFSFSILLATGVISLGYYVLLNKLFGTAKFKQVRLNRLVRKIGKSRAAEVATLEMVKTLPEEDKDLAIKAAAEATASLVNAYNEKRSEIVTLFESGLTKLSECRQESIKKARHAKSPEKFQKGISKLDEAITKLESALDDLRVAAP